MSANIARPNRAQLTAYLIDNEWTARQAKAFIDRHWTLLGSATYDDWEDLGVEWMEGQA